MCADFKPQISGSVTATVAGMALSSYKASGGASNVPAVTITTVATATYSATFNNISVISVSGQDYAKFFLMINNVVLDTRRSGPDRNLTFDYTSNPLKLNPGDIVDIKVEHYFTGNLLDFEATIYGYA